jgi:hypothetical protein
VNAFIDESLHPPGGRGDREPALSNWNLCGVQSARERGHGKGSEGAFEKLPAVEFEPARNAEARRVSRGHQPQ